MSKFNVGEKVLWVSEHFGPLIFELIETPSGFEKNPEEVWVKGEDGIEAWIAAKEITTLKSVEKLIDKVKAKQEKFPEFAPNPEKPLTPILFDGENIVVVSVDDGTVSENGIDLCNYCCFRNKSAINFCDQIRCDTWSDSVPEVIFLKEFKE